MSQPAARQGDMHTCPLFNGNVPHVGGPIIQGSPDVFIDGIAAARVGDPAQCNAPPDSISLGSTTVFINGMAAARQGDMTAHGGSIVVGSGTVFIG